MKAQVSAREFRYGNIFMAGKVRAIGFEFMAAGITYDRLDAEDVGCHCEWKDVQPIELNEEWLVNKFGWECFEDGWYGLHKFGLGYEFTWNIYDGLLRWKGSAIDCRFVHSLQNCYYAIKKQELSLKVSVE